MARSNNAPTNATWIICLVLYLIAILTHFGVIQLGYGIGTWAWILGFALLLLATKVRGL